MATDLTEKDSDLIQSSSSDALTPQRAAVLDVLRTSKGPLGPTAVHSLLGTDSSLGSVKNMLAALVRDGYIANEDRAYHFVTDHPTKVSDYVYGPTRPDPRASNAEMVELGTEALWIPLYPAFLGAGGNGGEPNDIAPEGAVPIPSSFARSQGIGSGPTFSAYVRGESMKDDFQDGDLVFGTLQEDYDREAIYALYLAGELLVKRVVRRLRGFELVSSNPHYAPIPIATDDVRLIGRVVGAISRV